MREFKVGDRVVLTDKCPGHWNCVGGMDKYLGATVTIKSINGTSFHIEQGDDTAYHWSFLFTDIFELESEFPTQKIVITANSTTTTAKLYEGKKVIRTAEAKCSPSDTFDFATGANLAYERLMDGVVEKPEPEYYNGKAICVDHCGGFDIYTIGKTYQFIDGRSINDLGNVFPINSPAKSFEDWQNWSSAKWIEAYGG